VTLEDEAAEHWLLLLRDGTPEQQALARTELGLIFESRGMLEEAAEAYWTNVKAQVRDRRPYRRLAAIYRQRGDALTEARILVLMSSAFSRAQQSSAKRGRRGYGGVHLSLLAIVGLAAIAGIALLLWQRPNELMPNIVTGADRDSKAIDDYYAREQQMSQDVWQALAALSLQDPLTAAPPKVVATLRGYTDSILQQTGLPEPPAVTNAFSGRVLTSGRIIFAYDMWIGEEMLKWQEDHGVPPYPVCATEGVWDEPRRLHAELVCFYSLEFIPYFDSKSAAEARKVKVARAVAERQFGRNQAAVFDQPLVTEMEGAYRASHPMVSEYIGWLRLHPGGTVEEFVAQRKR